MDQLVHPDEPQAMAEHVHRMNTEGQPEEILVRIPLRHWRGTLGQPICAAMSA